HHHLPPEGGEVTLTVGAPFSTFTATLADVVKLPAVSRATAVIVCEPLLPVVVSPAAEHGAVTSPAPRAGPSTRNCTPAAATLSVALAVTVIAPITRDPAAGEVTETVGELLSTVT